MRTVSKISKVRSKRPELCMDEEGPRQPMSETKEVEPSLPALNGRKVKSSWTAPLINSRGSMWRKSKTKTRAPILPAKTDVVESSWDDPLMDKIKPG